MSKPTWEDPIVKEVREIRDSIARQCNYDVRALFQHIKAHERASGRNFVTYPPNRIKPERPGQEGAA
jgi:hypothetical protein